MFNNRLSGLSAWIFGKVGIRQLLLLGFGLVLGCLALITALSHWRLGSTVEQVRVSAELQSRLADLSNEVKQQIGGAQIALLSTVVLSQPEDINYQREAMDKAFKAYAESNGKLKALLTEAESLQPLLEVHKAVEAEATATLMVISSVSSRIGDPDSREMLGSMIANSIMPAFDAWTKALDLLETQRKQLADTEAVAVESRARTARSGLLVLAALAIGAGVATAVAISVRVVRPIREAVLVAEQVARGELSQPINSDHGGEAGALMVALATMQQGLRSLVTEVRSASEGIALASSEIANGNQDLSDRTQSAAAELQQTAGSMQQVSESVRQTASAARHADEVAGRTRSAAQHGSSAIGAVVETNKDISLASNKIAEITGVIDGIAFQTNILALNAAVEAARAGESGRGFAVVASEVRALAQRSAEAARQIKDLIATNAETVERSSQQVQGAVAAISQVFGGVEEVSKIIAEINATARNQSGELQRVSQVVVGLDQKTQQNAALVEEAAAAADSLRDQTVRLQSLTRVFQVEEVSA